MEEFKLINDGEKTSKENNSSLGNATYSTPNVGAVALETKRQELNESQTNEKNDVNLRAKSKDEDIFVGLKRKAEIFGISSKQLENEFIDYKVERLMRKIDLFILSGEEDDELKKKIAEARKLGLGSLTVTPTQISKVKQLIEGTKLSLNSSIILNETEELTSVRFYAAKALKNTSVTEINLPIDKFALGVMRQKTTAHELKKMRKICKNKTLKVLIEPEKLNQNELSAVVRLLIETEIPSITARISENGMLKLKSLLSLCGNRVTVDVMGDFSLSFAASVLALGVRKLSIPNATDIGDEMRERIRNS